MQLPEWLLSKLACPRCKGPLINIPPELHCQHCRLAYPIRDGVPVLLPGEARPLPTSAS
jgi:hypothetical protein